MAEGTETEPTDEKLIRAVLSGETERFELLVARYQGRIFGTARRYARKQDEVEDIVQEIFLKAYRKLASFRGDAPFEHWLMRLAVRTCYDFLRQKQRSRETSFTELSGAESNWLENCMQSSETPSFDGDGARKLVQRLFEMLTPAARMVLTLQEIEGKSVKENAGITGWSISLVKVRAFRARNEMRRCLKQISLEKYL
jgi:RNA polymerase sigma-70 factor (ECF subfamily)